MQQNYHPSKWIKIFSSLALALLLSGLVQAQLNTNNSRPTLDPITDYTTSFSPDLRFIELNGITPGEENDQQVSIEVLTRDTDLVKSIGADLLDNGKAFINYQVKDGAAGTATVKVVVTDNGPTPSSYSRIFHITIEPLNREVEANPLPEEEVKLKAIPNPAYATTRIYFSTPQDEKLAVVDLYTLAGVKLNQLFRGSTLANRSYYVDVNGKSLANGAYIVRLTGQAHNLNLKLVIAK